MWLEQNNSFEQFENDEINSLLRWLKGSISNKELWTNTFNQPDFNEIQKQIEALEIQERTVIIEKLKELEKEWIGNEEVKNLLEKLQNNVLDKKFENNATQSDNARNEKVLRNKKISSIKIENQAITLSRSVEKFPEPLKSRLRKIFKFLLDKSDLSQPVL